MSKKEEIKIIKVSDDIQLRQMKFSDAPDLCSIIEKRNDYFARWSPIMHYMLDTENTDGTIVSMLDVGHLHQKHSYVIIYQGKVVGFIGFRNFDEINKKAELDYWLSLDYQKLGIATRSVIKLMDFAYNELNVNKIMIKCPVANFGSSNIPRKIGCKMEGVERAGELLNDNTFTDLEIYGMLRSEFNDIIFQN